jgi:hypothetical protein
MEIIDYSRKGRMINIKEDFYIYLRNNIIPTELSRLLVKVTI